MQAVFADVTIPSVTFSDTQFGLLLTAIGGAGTAIAGTIRVLTLVLRELREDYKALMASLVGMQKEQTTAIVQGTATVTKATELNTQTHSKVEAIAVRLESGLARQEEMHKQQDEIEEVVKGIKNGK